MNGTVVDPGVAVKWVCEEYSSSKATSMDETKLIERYIERNPHSGTGDARLKMRGSVWALIASLGEDRRDMRQLADALDV